MFRTAALLLCFAALSCAQDRREKKRIESVTWDLKDHKLIWVVQRGTEGPGGQFNVKSSDRYEISPDEAVMFFANEKRGFTSEEAASLHKLLDTLSVYCAESVVWWDRGEGQRLDDKSGDKLKVDEDKHHHEDRHHHQEKKRQKKTDPSSTQIAVVRFEKR